MSNTIRYRYNNISVHRKNPEWATDFSKTLLDGFYMREGESISQALARPATTFCFGDYDLAQRIYDYVYNGWFMYASPVLSNAQKGHWVPRNEDAGAHYWFTHDFLPQEKSMGLPISCFGAFVPDSLKGQIEMIQEVGGLSISGGGLGLHNGIRATSNKAPGPIPYMKVLDSTIGYFRQGKTRKGALSYYMSVDHPDIIEHIKFRVAGGDPKRRSDNRQQFHCAVNLTDKFIEAVKNNTEYDLICPHTKKVVESLNARKVWEEIIETRALTGEPFLVKIDAINRKMPETQKQKGLKIHGSNLCVAPETKILTDKGYVEIATKKDQLVNVWNGNEWSEVTVRQTGTNAELLKVVTNSGQELECTPYHKFYVLANKSPNNTKIVRKDASELMAGDRLIKFELPVIDSGCDILTNAYQNGFYSGDGCDVNHDGTKQRVYLYGEKRKLLHLFPNRIDHTVQDNLNREYFYVENLQKKYFVPGANYSIKSRVDWISGLIDSDGTLATVKTKEICSHNIQIASTNKLFLQNVQLMLQTLGVYSTFNVCRVEGDFLLPKNDKKGGKKLYHCKTVYRIVIAMAGMEQLKKLGVNTHRIKYPDVFDHNRSSTRFITVKEVIHTGRIADTYCFTEPKRNMGMFNGICTGNCTEITLPNDEDRTFVCCLSSLNLEKFDEWKDTTIVQDLIRFLDNVLEFFIRNAPDTLKKAKYSAEMERALGLGAFGWHSYLQSKSIAFESGGFNGAIQHNYKISKLIHERALESSRQLAVERGEAPDMIGTGLRNSRLLAIAPNANSADIAATSPACEPWYRNSFTKDTRAGIFVIKNKHLEALLESLGKNTKEVWKDIEDHDGSVQHLEFLGEHNKKVFRCAMEMDQRWLIEHANIRGEFICQAQSLNTYFPPFSEREYVNKVHTDFLKADNVLTMYYYRTEKASKVDKAKETTRSDVMAVAKQTEDAATSNDCLGCQG